MPEQTLLIATHNAGKMREYAEIFAGLRLRLMSLAEAGIGWPAEETGATFEENARLKAAAYCAASGLLTLADDSGLEVDALNGEPGVQSARYAGASATFAERIRLLLARLNGVPPSRRRARFRCVIAIAQPGGSVLTAEGVCEGEIGFEPRGEGGFGYDPIFFLPQYGQTMAELPSAEKHRISHRGKAAAAARLMLERLAREEANPFDTLT